MPKVSEAHRECQRAEILDAARACFAADGFHATSMQHILDASGKSAGAVYGYFASKSEIIAEIARQNVVAVLDALEACAETQPELTVADAVVEAAHRIRARHAEHHTAHIAVQVWAESSRDPEVQAHLADTHRRFRSAVTALLLRRNPDLAGADAHACAITALLPGFIVQLASLGDEACAQFEDGVRLLLAEL